MLLNFTNVPTQTLGAIKANLNDTKTTTTTPKWYESNYVIYGGVAFVLVVVLFFVFNPFKK